MSSLKVLKMFVLLFLIPIAFASDRHCGYYTCSDDEYCDYVQEHCENCSNLCSIDSLDTDWCLGYCPKYREKVLNAQTTISYDVATTETDDYISVSTVGFTVEPTIISMSYSILWIVPLVVIVVCTLMPVLLCAWRKICLRCKRKRRYKVPSEDHDYAPVKDCEKGHDNGVSNVKTTKTSASTHSELKKSHKIKTSHTSGSVQKRVVPGDGINSHGKCKTDDRKRKERGKRPAEIHTSTRKTGGVATENNSGSLLQSSNKTLQALSVEEDESVHNTTSSAHSTETHTMESQQNDTGVDMYPSHRDESMLQRPLPSNSVLVSPSVATYSVTHLIE